MPAAAPTRTSDPIGVLLRGWRRRRALSQLDLALDAGISARHLSFVETGRARPSAEMVLRLAEHLAVPLRERNALLRAAGYAALYPERTLDSPELAPARRALDRFLRAHEPFPALAVDRHGVLVAANDAFDLLTDGVAPELLEPPINILRMTLHPRGMIQRIVNAEPCRHRLLGRLRRQAVATGDPELAALHDELSAYAPRADAAAPSDCVDPGEIFLELRLRHDGEVLTFISTISTFGTAADILLEELSIEALYPADARTANRLLEGVAPGPDHR